MVATSVGVTWAQWTAITITRNMKKDGIAVSVITANKQWYVGAMNDGYFVIDSEPQPVPVDYACDTDHGINVIAACGSNKELADLLVGEHNARLKIEGNGASGFLRDVVYEAAQNAAIRNERERITGIIAKHRDGLKQSYFKGDGLVDRSGILDDLLTIIDKPEAE